MAGTPAKAMLRNKTEEGARRKRSGCVDCPPSDPRAGSSRSWGEVFRRGSDVCREVWARRKP